MSDDQREQAQLFIDGLWQSYLTSHGGKVSLEVLEAWRRDFAALLEVIRPDDE